ncbi:hypothetical protein FHS31_003165 [Sphingomonas vulcanisoli]|uniref:Uncharacterized protein n=1 Tax=Sphingomonas vulcanisoli TaxID=1658060 RepID=A0ABX0TVG2_9SPHN|nr:hypothetical protein [Sphingomonas vulcanisoli]NIJ09532.1 hypothetical protein [Sphingomonas vulcanisoli]
MATARQPSLPTATEDAWAIAMIRLHDADADFEIVRVELNRAEREYFDMCGKSGDDAAAISREANAKQRVDKAYANERIFGDALFEAAKAFYDTPSPDLPSAIRKIELLQQHGYDGQIEPLILADLRQLLPPA